MSTHSLVNAIIGEVRELKVRGGKNRESSLLALERKLFECGYFTRNEILHFTLAFANLADKADTRRKEKM